MLQQNASLPREANYAETRSKDLVVVCEPAGLDVEGGERGEGQQSVAAYDAVDCFKWTAGLRSLSGAFIGCPKSRCEAWAAEGRNELLV